MVIFKGNLNVYQKDPEGICMKCLLSTTVVHSIASLHLCDCYESSPNHRNMAARASHIPWTCRHVYNLYLCANWFNKSIYPWGYKFNVQTKKNKTTQFPRGKIPLCSSEDFSWRCPCRKKKSLWERYGTPWARAVESHLAPGWIRIARCCPMAASSWCHKNFAKLVYK